MSRFEDAVRAWHGAVVLLDVGTREQIVRPAAFVYEIASGLAWLEPSYADPFGAAAPSWHERLGQVSEAGPGFALVTAEGQTVDVVPYDAIDHIDMVGEALEWFGRWVLAEGRSWESERVARAPVAP